VVDRRIYRNHSARSVWNWFLQSPIHEISKAFGAHQFVLSRLMTADDKLSIARQRVENARATLDRQRALVADKKARGMDSEASEQLLATWERTLEVFESDLTALIKKSQSQPGQ
jgi:ABC-type phosphate/phosphonate transport system ATPase subunit